MGRRRGLSAQFPGFRFFLLSLHKFYIHMKTCIFSFFLSVLFFQTVQARKQHHGFSELQLWGIDRPEPQEPGVEGINRPLWRKGLAMPSATAVSKSRLAKPTRSFSATCRIWKPKSLQAISKKAKSFWRKTASAQALSPLPAAFNTRCLLRERAKPMSTDKVTVHYTGTLLNGTVFDSSVERGEPATFGVTQVIQGWVEALQLMETGAKWKLFIPHDLAYGERGAGRNIGPFSTLIFEVELLKIN